MVVHENTGRARELGTIQERFAGVDTPSAIAGMFTALGVLAFLSSLLAAGAASIPYQLNLLDADGVLQEFEMIGYLVVLAVIAVAFFVGGWTAGRMARVDGGITAVASAAWMLLLMVAFAAGGAFFGAEYNAFAQAELPDWISQIDADEITVGAGIATIVAILVMFLASWLGGRTGETYHRDVERLAVESRYESSAATPT